jgi:hypothetical protein
VPETVPWEEPLQPANSPHGNNNKTAPKRPDRAS